MLKISFTPIENMILSIDVSFKFMYEPEWFEDPLVKQMVLDIDKTDWFI